MFKTVSSVLLASGLAQAATIDAFHPINFLQVDVAKTLVKQVIEGTPAPNATGVISFSQCSDDFGAFKFDAANTTPKTLAKGSTINFDLKGAVTQPIEVTNCHLNVLWNGTNLFTHDYKQDNKYTQVFDYKDLSWPVPSFAPSGHYNVTLLGQGVDGGKNGNVWCVNA